MACFKLAQRDIFWPLAQTLYVNEQNMSQGEGILSMSNKANQNKQQQCLLLLVFIVHFCNTLNLTSAYNNTTGDVRKHHSREFGNIHRIQAVSSITNVNHEWKTILHAY